MSLQCRSSQSPKSGQIDLYGAGRGGISRSRGTSQPPKSGQIDLYWIKLKYNP